MREIKLVNNEGEEFDLTRPDACLQDISGIGMEIEFETVRIGQCDVVVDEQPQYNPVSGMIPFMDMEPYTEFLQFIAKRPITLAYKPKNVWYFTSVRVSVMEKEEITPVDEYAETDVDFYRLGPWYSTLRIEPYTESETNTKLNGKANSSHTHTKDQVGLSKVNNNAIGMGYDGNLWISFS